MVIQQRSCICVQLCPLVCNMFSSLHVCTIQHLLFILCLDFNHNFFYNLLNSYKLIILYQIKYFYRLDLKKKTDAKFSVIQWVKSIANIFEACSRE